MLLETEAKRKECPLKVNTTKGIHHDKVYFGSCDGKECMSWAVVQPTVERYDTPECRKELAGILPHRACKSTIQTKSTGSTNFVYLDSIGECRNPKVVGPPSAE